MTLVRHRVLGVLLCLAVVAPGCSSPASSPEPDAATVPPTPVPPAAPNVDVDVGSLPGEPVTGDLETTPTGLRYAVLEEGTGPQPGPGANVTVAYTGYLLDGTSFDSGEIPFQVGMGAVIAGWDEAILMMQVGEKRKLVVPPELGYGAAGFPGAIPPNATLVFDVELVAVQ
jgi:peptidylprolyl isomerase